MKLKCDKDILGRERPCKGFGCQISFQGVNGREVKKWRLGFAGMVEKISMEQGSRVSWAHSHFPGTVYTLLILLAQTQINSGIISL